MVTGARGRAAGRSPARIDHSTGVCPLHARDTWCWYLVRLEDIVEQAAHLADRGHEQQLPEKNNHSYHRIDTVVEPSAPIAAPRAATTPLTAAARLSLVDLGEKWVKIWTLATLARSIKKYCLPPNARKFSA